MIECLECERKGDPYDNWICEECYNRYINDFLSLKKEKTKLIVELLEGLYKYRDQIGFQKHISLDLLIEYWEARK